MRFKIDMTAGSYEPFVLLVKREGLLWPWWEKITTFKSRADAMAHYELIKDLPEYLP